MRATTFYLVDVREPAEWEIISIPGAVLIPKGDLAGRLAELPQDKPVIAYCKSGVRSAESLALLKNAGFADAKHVQGGITAWTHPGPPRRAALLVAAIGSRYTWRVDGAVVSEPPVSWSKTSIGVPAVRRDQKAGLPDVSRGHVAGIGLGASPGPHGIDATPSWLIGLTGNCLL